MKRERRYKASEEIMILKRNVEIEKKVKDKNNRKNTVKSTEKKINVIQTHQKRIEQISNPKANPQK